MSDYRNEARQQLKRAQAELATGDDERIKYAALELREAMESLTYDRALAYKDDFPPQEYETWQPQKVMALLLEIDPAADKDGALAFGLEPAYGEPPQMMHSLGTEMVLNMKTLKDHYHALGSHLHVQSLKDRRAGKELDYAAIRERCGRIAEFITKVMGSSVFNQIFGHVASTNCMECGASVRKRWPKGKTKINAKCFKCGAEYIVEDSSDGKCNWQPDFVDFICAKPDCGKPFGLWRSEIKVGTAWECPACGGRNGLVVGVVHLSREATPAET